MTYNQISKIKLIKPISKLSIPPPDGGISPGTPSSPVRGISLVFSHYQPMVRLITGHSHIPSRPLTDLQPPLHLLDVSNMILLEERLRPEDRLALTTTWYSVWGTSWSITWLVDTGFPTGYTVK